MRIVVIILVLLASAKVWSQDRTYRTVMGDALVKTYSERVLDACRRLSATRTPSATATTMIWSRDTEIEATIGNSDVNVAIWDTENPLWSRRFRDPHIVLTSTAFPGTRCAYDLNARNASLSR